MEQKKFFGEPESPRDRARRAISRGLELLKGRPILSHEEYQWQVGFLRDQCPFLTRRNYFVTNPYEREAWRLEIQRGKGVLTRREMRDSRNVPSFMGIILRNISMKDCPEPIPYPEVICTYCDVGGYTFTPACHLCQPLYLMRQQVVDRKEYRILMVDAQTDSLSRQALWDYTQEYLPIQEIPKDPTLRVLCVGGRYRLRRRTTSLRQRS